jgi:AraC-like DNA-binding protein
MSQGITERRVGNDRYVLKSLLGRGGMGVVWRAEDTLLDRAVALKVFKRGRSSTPLAVLDEARAAAALNHPGVVSVFDTGSEDSIHYIVMERVEGRTLADVLAEEDDDVAAAVLDRALVPLAPEPTEAYLRLQDLLEAMAGDRGLVRVDQVAALAGVGVRSLQRLFAAYVGVSPKWVLGRYRLQDAAAAIDAGAVDDLAALAAELGWFDQAHFSRDFRAVVGTTPSAYLQCARSAR